MERTDDPGSDDALAVSQRQFGAHAANYAVSPVHARGASLQRLVEVIEPEPDWRGLDIASAAGHTAFAFAPHVASMVSSDATEEMLEVATGLAEERGIDNVTFEFADAHALPYPDASFDLVTCRIAPHHFADPATFVAEVARVLVGGGYFGLVDNIAPKDPATARWVDHFERRRDPSHQRYLPLTEWLHLIEGSGLVVATVETLGKAMDFQTWAERMSVSPSMQRELLDDLAGADPGVRDWLRPELGDRPSFVLTEGLIAALKP